MKTPVLLMIFNRPKETKKVFEAIRRAKPELLFIAADGPRKGVIGETELCAMTRKITEKINWPCEVKRLYRNKNLGGGGEQAITEAITWFFKYVREGIIFEDDCLPSEFFFVFCEQMLAKYRNDKNIMHISGDNFQTKKSKISNSYYFSKYANCWGWATWRRAWKKYDSNLKDWPKIKKERKIDYVFGSLLEKIYWYSIFDLRYKNFIHAFDYAWLYSIWKNRALSITPGVNLVENIGFNKRATHTKSTSKLRVGIEKMEFPLVVPKEKIRNFRRDNYDMRHAFGVSFQTAFYYRKEYYINLLSTKIKEFDVLAKS